MALMIFRGTCPYCAHAALEHRDDPRNVECGNCGIVFGLTLGKPHETPKMQPKDGRLECEEVLSWVRRRACLVGALEQDLGGQATCMGRVQAHHVDGKGMGGARCRDDRVVPLCGEHHAYVHRHQDSEGLVTREKLHVWSLETLAAFLEEADPPSVRAYVLALERLKERRLWIPS